MNWNWLHTCVKWHGEKARKPNLLTSGAWRLMWNKCYISVDLWTSAPCIPYLSPSLSERVVGSVATVLWFPVHMIFNSRQEFKITSFDSGVLTVLHCRGTGNTGTTEMFEILNTCSGTESWVLCQLRYSWVRKKTTKKKKASVSPVKIINKKWMLQEEKNKNEKQYRLMCLAKIIKMWNYSRTNKQQYIAFYYSGKKPVYVVLRLNFESVRQYYPMWIS